MLRALLLVALAAACSNGAASDPRPAPAPVAPAPAAPPPSKHSVKRFAVELRQKVNTCGAVDATTAFDTFTVWRDGDAALVIAGTDRVFAVRADESQSGVALSGKIVEPEPARVGGRAVICKKNTIVDLEMKGEGITGSYTREGTQDCAAKGCAVTFAVEGRPL